MKRESESGDVDLRRGSIVELLDAFRGCIVFIKTVVATNVNYKRGYSCNGLNLPKWFVEGNRKRLCKDVVLRTHVKAKNLTFKFNRKSGEVPRVIFSKGWKPFAMSNNLAIGNQLLFKLSGMSQFHVYIFKADGTQKELPGDGSMPQGLLAKEEARELPNEKENVDVDRNIHVPSVPNPSFVKRLTETKFFGSTSRHTTALEMPADFTRTHSNLAGGQLRTLVTLQGISDQESPAYLSLAHGQIIPPNPCQGCSSDLVGWSYGMPTISK